MSTISPRSARKRKRSSPASTTPAAPRSQFAGDISKRDEFAALFDEAGRAFGKVDIVVNNATVAPLTCRRSSRATGRRRPGRQNVKGTLYRCQLAVDRLADDARIINISSSATGLTLPGYGTYDMSKCAIEQLTRILAKEVGPAPDHRQRDLPGATETKTYRVGKDPEFVAGLARMPAFNRLGQVDYIVACSHRARRQPSRTTTETGSFSPGRCGATPVELGFRFLPDRIVTAALRDAVLTVTARSIASRTPASSTRAAGPT